MSDTPRPLPSLYHKTLLALLAVVAVVAFTGGAIGIPALEQQAVRHLTQSLATQARLMEPEVRRSLTDTPTAQAVQPLASQLGQRAQCRVTVIAPTGSVLGDSHETLAGVAALENHANRPEVASALQGGIGSSLRYSTTVRRAMLYVAQAVVEEGRTLGVLRLALPADLVTELRREIQRDVVWILLLGAGLAALVGIWMARRVTRPLRQLTDAATSYASGDLAVKANDAPIREVHELSLALNAMAHAIREQLAELTTSKHQLAAIVESMAEGVMAVDGQARILLLNPSARLLLGLAEGDVIGQSAYETVRDYEANALVRGVLQDARRATKDVTLFQPQERMIRLHGVPCQGGGPSGPRAVLVIQDVTESNRFERLRKEFVANVSHELKSPLTSIRSLTETLLEGALDDRANNRRFVQLIDEDAARLSRLIEDLLSLSQIESQAVPPHLAVVELKPALESVLAALQTALAKRDLKVTLELPANTAVRADPDQLQQVLFNLIDNAIKYNKTGGRIALSASHEGSMVSVVVSDTGIGIPESDLSRIFERFYRVDKARSRELGGTGLGLSIVKHLVEFHHGQVAVTSHLGRGSTFTVTLPRATSA